MKRCSGLFAVVLLLAGTMSQAYRVRFCGANEDGQQGFVDYTQRLVPIPNLLMADMVKDVACGLHHILILTTAGDVYAVGDNTYGQLGVGSSYPSTSVPYKLTGLENIKAIAAGNYHSLFLDNEGSVWACGRNDSGQLGVPGASPKFLPVETVYALAVEIDCGFLYSAVRSADGTVRVTGYNGYGQLGQGDTVNRYSWVQVVPDFAQCTGMSCGNYHLMLMAAGGALSACGRNDYGQLGTGDNIQYESPTPITNSYNGAVQVACGRLHTLILEADGTVRACGYNGYGQLGMNDVTSRNLFAEVPGTAGKGVEICAGYNQSLIRLGSGEIKAAGRNANGELGLGDQTNRIAFTRVPGAWTCLAMDTGYHNSGFVTTCSTAPNDFDGDGRSDIAVYWPETGYWYIRQSGNGEMFSGGPVSWGWSDAVPATGDFDGDGFADISVYHRLGGTMYIDYTLGGGDTVSFSGARYAVVGDYDGDGVTDFGVYAHTTGGWVIPLSSGGTLMTNWGWSGAQPVGLQH